MLPTVRFWVKIPTAWSCFNVEKSGHSHLSYGGPETAVYSWWSFGVRGYRHRHRPTYHRSRRRIAIYDCHKGDTRDIPKGIGADGTFFENAVNELARLLTFETRNCHVSKNASQSRLVIPQVYENILPVGGYKQNDRRSSNVKNDECVERYNALNYSYNELNWGKCWKAWFEFYNLYRNCFTMSPNVKVLLPEALWKITKYIFSSLCLFFRFSTVVSLSLGVSLFV